MIPDREQAPLLSIVVPTVTRRAILETTLSSLLREVEGLGHLVELIVVDNASEDDTADFLRGCRWPSNARFALFSERVPFDASFERCVALSKGQYINIFGDDDLPIPGLVGRMVELIQQNADIALIYFNRLLGDADLRQIGELAHPNLGVETRSMSAVDFIGKFAHWPGFITSIVFDRSCWQSTRDYDSSRYAGYQFLARIYQGVQGRSCIYVGLPGLIQRRGIQHWKKEWPRFWLVNMPRMLSDFDTSGRSRGALHQWRSEEITLKRVLIDGIVAKAFGYQVGDPFWREAVHYQGRLGAITLHLVRWLVPKWLAAGVYFRTSKYKS